MPALIECVPNISEGRRLDVVNQIVEAVKATPGLKWLDQTSDPDHNRSVLTFLGEPAVLKAALDTLFTEVSKHIDLTTHQGGHPRMGAVDVVPFIPIADCTMADCVALAKDVAKLVAEKFNVPVVLYEEAASAPHRKNLADVRKGQFEGLQDKLAKPEWAPDFGNNYPHPHLGATAIGAREALIAYNVYLHTSDLKIANEIAKAVRGSSGGMAYVKGMGLYTEERNQVQVSMNLVNYKKNPIYRVFELIKIEAARWGVQVAGSEIVGLVPQDALLETAAYYLQVEGYNPAMVLENKIRTTA
ncbi:MAG: glutamate formiminotransferase [Cyanobacteria bacterium RYN_339]|nr:glutamate formiminotransferase [Cyanobacteria bacterium RYN_339]